MLKAAENGDIEIVKLLIDNGSNINDLYYGYTPLHKAAENGDIEIVKLLLENGADINAVDDDYSRTPLHYAAYEGQKEVCQLLLEKGAHINAVDYDGKTPLHDAVVYGHKEICQLLLEKGANINVVDDEDRTPLHYAAYCGCKEICQLLIEKGANINAVDNYGKTPLYDAAHESHKEVCRLLLEKGADINAVDNYGWTLLHKGAKEGSVEVVSVLIENDADINAVNLSGYTPLDIAEDIEVKTLLKKHGAKEGDGFLCGEVFSLIKKGDIKKLKELIKENPDIVKFKNTSGNTTLLYAIEAGNNDIVELLISSGAEITDWSLCAACIYQNTEMVKLLIEAGANVNGAGYGCPLNMAFENGGNREIIKILVKNGANVNVCPELTGPYWAQPNNILEIAVAWEDLELIELFIEKGLSPDSVIGNAIYIKDKKIVKILLDNGAKSLHGAAFIGDIELAKSFLDEGFDINEKIALGSCYEYSDYTPLDWAKIGGNKDMMDFLISNGGEFCYWK